MRSVGAHNIQFAGLILAISLGLVGCAQSPTKTESSKSANSKDLAIPPEFKDDTEAEFQLGRLLKIYDDVAWLSTDALRAAGYVDDSKKPVTYVVEPTGSDLNGIFRATFISDESGKLNVVGVAEVKHDSGMGHVTGAQLVNPPISPSEPQIAMFNALVTANKAPGLELCHALYNHVIVPFSDNGKIEYRVYFMMSTTTPGEIPIGGGVLVRVAEDGKTVLEVRPLAKSCMMAEPTETKNSVMIVFADWALDSPSAAQVFLMWRYQKIVAVKTRNNYVWSIDSNGIRLLADGSKSQ